jgi:hypothetical protein
MATRTLKVNVTDEWKAERVRLATDAINALIAFTAHEQHVAGTFTTTAQLLGHIATDPDWQPYAPKDELDDERDHDLNDIIPDAEWVGMCRHCDAPIGARDTVCGACGRSLA